VTTYPVIAYHVVIIRNKTDIMDIRGQTMSNWQNVGVKDKEFGTDIPTKAALKRALEENRANVTFYSTDAVGANQGKRWNGRELDHTVKYTVVGPNPYTSRKWYATVEFTQTGVLRVK
jgi:hypothetical protein